MSLIEIALPWGPVQDSKQEKQRLHMRFPFGWLSAFLLESRYFSFGYHSLKPWTNFAESFKGMCEIRLIDAFKSDPPRGVSL